jgi:hypothetical protein
VRFVVVVALAACGRQNFESRDAAAPIDTAIDADTRLPGLLVWYRMEDDPGDGTLDDSSGNARVARCVAAINCPTQVAGKRGNAAAFNGAQYARTSYGAWLATPLAYSIAAWIYLDTQVDQVAFAKPFGTGALDAWGITAWAPASGSGTCLETVDATQNGEWVCGPTLTATRWFHVAGRWDGGAKALFIDGVKVGEITTSPVSMIDSHDLVIGSDENGGMPAYSFTGRVDELQVYDRALTDAEIVTLAAP